MGHSDAQYQLGLFYEYGGTSSFTNYKEVCKINIKEALKWYIEAAEKGNTDAQVRLGNAFYYGQLGCNRNWSTSVKWYTEASGRGNSLAREKLHKCQEMGDESSWGADSFRELALKGDSVAQCKLGDCYLYGFGVPKHIGAARLWYQKAALKNNSVAMARLKEIDEEQDLPGKQAVVLCFLFVILFVIFIAGGF